MNNADRLRCNIILASIASVVAVLLVLAVLAFGSRTLFEKLPANWRIWLMALRHGVEVDHGQIVKMPDGTRLAASLYRPRSVRGRLPTVLIRLPYHRLRYGEGYNNGIFFASMGYAVLVQDLRGTGASDGELVPWANTATDAAATLEWITQQPWSDGNVGTFGCSALGETQLVSQDTAPPAWRAMIVSGAGGAVGSLGGRYAYFGLFEGGIFQLASGFGWFVDSGAMRPDAPAAGAFDRPRLLRELPVNMLVSRVRPSRNGYNVYLSTPLASPQWSKWGFLDDTSRLRVPVLVVNTWGDQTIEESLTLAEHWRKADPDGTRGRQKVIIAAGNHCDHHAVGETGRFGELAVANAAQPYRQFYLRWFDHWLRGNGDALAELPNYTYYVVGADTWLQADSWPPAESRIERWYLGSDGSANSRSGNGRLSSNPLLRSATDTWRYNPADPVPSRGGPICCTGNPEDRPGPADQADVERRNDVLVYTTPPMPSDIWIAGQIRANLLVSSDAKDTDLVARLVHVWPDERATNIQEGALRLRYRNGFVNPELLEPGSPVRAVVHMRSVAYRLPKGHRLRLHVTSSSFPRLQRNLNTGGDNAAEQQMVTATNTVHYDIDGGSWLELPMLPRP